MLNHHFNSIENVPSARSGVAANTGHSHHEGAPREAFAKEFLAGHLSERVSIGTGEIIHRDSRPGDRRNQYDIVIYRKDYPKIDYGGGISGFLVDSVVAVIEVKSTLDRIEFQSAVESARNLKTMRRSVTASISSGYIPPAAPYYIMAYDGPAKMETIQGWIDPIHNSLGITPPIMGPRLQERIKVASPSIDGVFVLDKGFMVYDNVLPSLVDDAIRVLYPTRRWVFANVDNGILLYLFIILKEFCGGFTSAQVDLTAYLTGWGVSNLKYE